MIGLHIYLVNQTKLLIGQGASKLTFHFPLCVRPSVRSFVRSFVHLSHGVFRQ